jgi:hypothetical protein
MAYLYRHIRQDTNVPFYIGIGSEIDYGRAYDKSERSKHWKNIISITDYRIDIILDNLTWEEACQKEIEFIKLYGRKDKNEGTLCNFTDGGEGPYGRILSKETRQKISKSVSGVKHGMFGKKHTENAINKISEAASKKVIDQSTGIIYCSIKDAALQNNIRPNTLTRKLSGIRNNNTNFRLMQNGSL